MRGPFLIGSRSGVYLSRMAVKETEDTDRFDYIYAVVLKSRSSTGLGIGAVRASGTRKVRHFLRTRTTCGLMIPKDRLEGISAHHPIPPC